MSYIDSFNEEKDILNGRRIIYSKIIETRMRINQS